MSNFKYLQPRRRRPLGKKAEEEKEERKRNNTKTGKEKREKQGEEREREREKASSGKRERERASEATGRRSSVVEVQCEQVSRRNEASERVSVRVGETTKTCPLLSSLGYHLTLDPRREEQVFKVFFRHTTSVNGLRGVKRSSCKSGKKKK